MTIRTHYSALLLTGFSALLPITGSAQPSTRSSVWELHRPHSGPFDNNGLKLESTATSRLPALDIAGHVVGSFDVVARCNTEFLNIDATLTGAHSYEVVRIPANFQSQVPNRSQVTVTLSGKPAVSTMSIAKELNTVEIQFLAPGFDNIPDAAKGLIVLTMKLNGNVFIGTVADLYTASTLGLDVFAKRSSSTDSVHFTIKPQDPSFQAFADSCRELQPGQRDDHLVLMQRSDDAAKLLLPAESAQLRSIISIFDQALKTNNELALNESYTHLANLEAFGPEKRCATNDKRACEADEAFPDVRDAMKVLQASVKAKSDASNMAARLLAPARTPLTFTFPEQIPESQITRGSVVTARLASPFLSGTSVVVEQGALVHLTGSILGGELILGAKDVARNGTMLPLSTSQCRLDLTADTAISGYRRPQLSPGKRPFGPGPRADQAPANRYVAAGSSCSVITLQPFMQN